MKNREDDREDEELLVTSSLTALGQWILTVGATALAIGLSVNARRANKKAKKTRKTPR